MDLLGDPYRKYIQQITQPSQYRYAKLQYRFAVTSGSPSNMIFKFKTSMFTKVYLLGVDWRYTGERY